MSYLLAALLGITTALWLFPLSEIFPVDGLVMPPFGDAALHVTGQIAFLRDAWRWPPLQTLLLMPPEGVSIGLTDSIPLVAILLKVIRGVLPPEFHGITLWLGLSWAFQPIAAVFAVRSMGERRPEVEFIAAVFSLCVPMMYVRDAHAPLSAHFFLMMAIGFYCRACHGHKRVYATGCGLTPVVFLVNPYLAVMYATIIGAAPITLWVRSRIIFKYEFASWMLGCASVLPILWIGGYAGTVSEGGFTHYSMNLFSPIYPGGSRLLFGLYQFIDGTGGQYEGYAYLGLGAIGVIVLAGLLSVDAIREFAARRKAICFGLAAALLVMVVYSSFHDWHVLFLENSTQYNGLIAFTISLGIFWVVCLARGEMVTIIGRHAGLTLVCVSMGLFALSTKIYAGHRLLFDFGDLHLFDQFRASGRFIWPAVYVCTIGSVAYTARRLDRQVVLAFLSIAALIQAVDTGGLRHHLWLKHHSPTPWAVDTILLRKLLLRSDELTIWPAFNCGASVDSPIFEQLVLLSVVAGIPTNSSRVARRKIDFACPAAADGLRSIREGELRTLLPGGSPGAWQSIENADSFCSPNGAIVICSRQLDDAPRPIPVLAVGEEVLVAPDQAGRGILDQGWSAEPWGAWSDGWAADLLFRSVGGPLTLTLRASGFLLPWATSNLVAIDINGGYMGSISLAREEQEFRIDVPEGANPTGLIHMVIQIPLAMSPKQLGMSDDPRHIGMALRAIRVEAAVPTLH